MGAFQVERSPDYFEPVKANFYKFEHGDLLLHDLNGDLVIAYARGAWITVHYDEDFVWQGATTAPITKNDLDYFNNRKA